MSIQTSSPSSSAGRFDLIVAGAGIMGMACALEEAARGKRVCIIDPNPPATKASWAAAGLLVTRAARRFLSPFREFYVRSIGSYPEWTERIASLAGRGVAIHGCPDYQFFDTGSENGYRQYLVRMDQLRKEEALDYEVSEKAPDFLKGRLGIPSFRLLHFPREAYVNNRDLLETLGLACTHSGVIFRTGRHLTGLRAEGPGVVVRLADGMVAAPALLLAAGAWTDGLLRRLGLAGPLVPVKGQMMRIPRFHAAEALLHFNEDIYLVPRGNDLVLGATTEPGIWEEDFNERGAGYLESRLRRFVPSASNNPLETWSGIRPRTKDRLPLMGWVDADKTVAVCAGHYKCGISMAPLSALCLSRLLNGERPPVDLAPFHPWRKKGLRRLQAEVRANAEGEGREHSAGPAGSQNDHP